MSEANAVRRFERLRGDVAALGLRLHADDIRDEFAIIDDETPDCPLATCRNIAGVAMFLAGQAWEAKRQRKPESMASVVKGAIERATDVKMMEVE